MTTQAIPLGTHITLELAQRDGIYLGMGGISAGGTRLRSAARPMSTEIRNPDGIVLCNYRISSFQSTTEGCTIDFTVDRREGGIMEWMLHTVRNRYNTADWSAEAYPAEGTTLRLTLLPVERRFGNALFRGFSYQYTYSSAAIPIYKILDRGTWEVGGNALGNTFWLRNSHMPPLYTFTSADQHYSTEWYLPSAENPNIFQFLPLQTQLQGFTFTESESGVLVTWATGVSHIRSLFEKPRGSDVIVHWHEHCGDLSTQFQTVPMEVLWHDGHPDRVGMINLYEQVRDYVWGALHADIGMRQERVTTYGVIEQWDDPDFGYYTRRGVPKLLDAGVKTIMIPNQFRNNMNTYGVSNMCCTVDYQFGESPTQSDVKSFCDAVRGGGGVVEMWGNTSVSTLTPILDRKDGRSKRVDFIPDADTIMRVVERAKRPWVKNPSGAIEADHYTPVFAVLNLRDPDIRAYWHQRWRAAHDEVGIGGIFLDSSFNLSSDKFDFVYNTENERVGTTIDQTAFLNEYRPATPPQSAVLSQYRAHLELMVEMQHYGYVYCGEDTGVFGISRSGPAITFRLDNLFMWMECLIDFERDAIREAGHDPDHIFFRALAYRLMWKLYWNIQHDAISFRYSADSTVDAPSEWHLSLLKVFNRVSAWMVNRTVLSDERGVLYQQDGRRVLWAFSDLTLPLDQQTSICDLTTEENWYASEVSASQHHVYLIGEIPPHD
jgi:hypothetical protein